MSFALSALRAAVAAHGRVARVLVVDTAGSAPREAGADMLVWQDGQSGTIGGGTLEHEAMHRARARLASAQALISRIPLGPALGQCCGGSVTLVTEIFDRDALLATDTTPDGRHRVIALDGTATEPPLSVRRLLSDLRNGRTVPGPRLLDGWLVEPLESPRKDLWVWGAGHVGRAVVDTLAPLPEWTITWIDIAEDRYPPEARDKVTVLVAADPVRAVPHAPKGAHHLILTYSHALDLDLCHALLGHGFASAGLIGSATKRQRFRRRLGELGHDPAEIARIACPIGNPSLGKHPQAIAIGVAADLLGAPAKTAGAIMDKPA